MAANTSSGRYILVNHEGPDFDSIVSTFLWLKAMGKKITDIDLQFRFVPVGCRLSLEESAPDDTVVHFDTGQILDPVNNNFDHHGYGLNGEALTKHFGSAARTVYNAFCQLQRDPVIGDIVELADRVDSGQSVNYEDAETRLKRESFKTELDEFNARGEGIVLLVTEAGGPREIVSLVSNLEVENNGINDTDKLIACILILDKWYEDKIANKAVSETVSKKEAEKFDRLATTFIATMDPDLFGINDMESLERFYRTVNLDSPCAAIQAQKTARTLWYNTPVTEIAELAKLIREKQTTLVESEATRQFRETLTARLAGFNEGRKQKLALITLRRGPWDIIKYLPGEEYSERFQLMLGLTLLRAWYNKKTIRSKVQRLVEGGEKVEANELIFVRVPETNLTSKAVRYQLRRYYSGFNRIDVLVATYCDQRRGFKYLGVTMAQNNVAGMDELFKRLKEIDAQADIYIYPETNFVIYIRINGRETPLTPELVLNEAVHILRPATTDKEESDEESMED